MTQSILELQIAIRENNITKVKSLIAAGVDVNEYLENRETVIMEAAYYSNLEIVKILVETGAKVSAWSEGETAIILAAKNAKRDIYDYLYPLLDDYTRQYANKYGELTIRNPFIKKERLANKDIEKFIDDALSCKLNNVKKLIDKGIDVNAIGSDGKTALMFASRQYYIDIVEVLLINGNANPDIINYHENDGEGEGKTALMYITHENTNLYGNHYKNLFKLFKKAKANFDLQGEGGNTALMFAASIGNINAVRELIKIGVNLDLKDDNQNTALMLAQSHFQPESTYEHIDHLLKQYNCLKPKYVEIIKLLKEQGASQTGLENIALIDAAEKGNIQEVQRLINIGADVNVRVEDYLNPLEYAEYSFAITKDFDQRMRYLDIIEIIENAGATREYFD